MEKRLETCCLTGNEERVRKMSQPVKKLRITLVKSVIGNPARQKKNVRALGIHHLNQTVELADNPCVRGMVKKVIHLVSVEEKVEE